MRVIRENKKKKNPKQSSDLLEISTTNYEAKS